MKEMIVKTCKKNRVFPHPKRIARVCPAMRREAIWTSNSIGRRKSATDTSSLIEVTSVAGLSAVDKRKSEI